MSATWEKIFEIASHVTHPYSVAACAAVLTTIALVIVRNKHPRIATALAVFIFVLGISPLVATTYLAQRGIYHIRIVVLAPNGQPDEDAEVTSSAGGEPKRGVGSWEIDLPSQGKPASGQIVLYASLKDAYLGGQSALELRSDYFPEVEIHLAPLPQVDIRGVVVDELGRSVRAADVSIVGFPEIATTDAMGNFSLPSHHAEGQLVEMRAEKGNLFAHVSAIAGKEAQLILRKE